MEIDGVEIDPAVTDAGFRFLGLGDNPRLTRHDADARPFLRRTGRRYDLVYVDAYHQPYVPFYLATREFFELVRERLRPGGLVALNVATVPGDRRLVARARRDARDACSRRCASGRCCASTTSWSGSPSRSPGPRAPDDRRARAARAPAATPAWRAGARRPDEPWTDDHAPVEWVTDRMIVEYAARGGDLDEAQLPTAPR